MSAQSAILPIRRPCISHHSISTTPSTGVSRMFIRMLTSGSPFQISCMVRLHDDNHPHLVIHNYITASGLGPCTRSFDMSFYGIKGPCLPKFTTEDNPTRTSWTSSIPDTADSSLDTEYRSPIRKNSGKQQAKGEITRRSLAAGANASTMNHNDPEVRGRTCCLKDLTACPTYSCLILDQEGEGP